MIRPNVQHWKIFIEQIGFIKGRILMPVEYIDPINKKSMPPCIIRTQPK